MNEMSAMPGSTANHETATNLPETEPASLVPGSTLRGRRSECEMLDRLVADVLAGLLPQIDTPVQIIAGAGDTAVPPANASFLHERLPHSQLDVIDAGHFTWEDAPAEYAALVTSWWHGAVNGAEDG